MATEVQMSAMPVENEESAFHSPEKKATKKKKIMGVFKKKKSLSQDYDNLSDTPPTAPSTPDGPMEFSVNVMESDPAMDFSDDDDELMAQDVPETFDAGDVPAQFKVPTSFVNPEEDVLPPAPPSEGPEFEMAVASNQAPAPVVDDIYRDLELEDSASGNDSEAKKEKEGLYGYLFCNPKQAQSCNPTTVVNCNQDDDSTVYNTRQQATGLPNDKVKVSTPIYGDEQPRHENFEVVLDASYFSPGAAPDDEAEEKKESDDKDESADVAVVAASSRGGIPKMRSKKFAKRFLKKLSPEKQEELASKDSKNDEHYENAVDIQRDLEGLEREMNDNGSEPSDQRNELARDLQVETQIAPEPEQEAVPSSAEKKNKKVSLKKLKKLTKSLSLSTKKLAFNKEPEKLKKIVEKDDKQVSLAAVNAPAPEKPKKPKAAWKAVMDSNTNKLYYYHRKTRETTWTKPAEYKAHEEAMKKFETDLKTYNDIASGKIPHEIFTAPQEDSEETKAKKQEIRQILANTDDAPDEAAVNELLQQYAGREDALLHQLKEVIETTPFDEPFEDQPFDCAEDPKVDPTPLASNGRVVSQFSRTSTTITEQTQKINNTNRNRGSLLKVLSEDHSSISTDNFDQLMGEANIINRLPSTVNGRRERELMVEDLGTKSRVQAETFDKNGRVVKGRELTVDDGDDSIEDDILPAANDSGNNEVGDNVSVLSEMDTDYSMRRENFRQARRRALDDAIKREDWDLAAALTEGMRHANYSSSDYEEAHSNWNQSEIHKFIADNDWAAVQAYIAQMRDKKNASSTSTEQNQAQPTKILGSQSRLPRKDVSDESCWSAEGSQASESDYSG